MSPLWLAPYLSSEVTEASGSWTDQIYWCCWEVVKIIVSHWQGETMAVVWWHSHRLSNADVKHPHVTALNALLAVSAFLLFQQQFFPYKLNSNSWDLPGEVPSAVCDAGLGSWSLWEPWVPAQGLESQGQDKGTGSAGPACSREVRDSSMESPGFSALA